MSREAWVNLIDEVESNHRDPVMIREHGPLEQRVRAGDLEEEERDDLLGRLDTYRADLRDEAGDDDPEFAYDDDAADAEADAEDGFAQRP